MRAVKRLRQNLRFLSNRPALLARGAFNAGALGLGRPRLRLLDLELTHRCPCRCEQCYADFPVPPSERELTVPEIADLVEQARRLGALQVLLSGGEPLVRRDLEDVIAASRPALMLVTMCTSGAGLTEARLRGLARAGLAVLVFSLDALEARVHDANRGFPGLHARVLSAALEARELGVSVLFNTVATKEKLASGEIGRLADLAGRQGATLNLTIPTPQGRWERNGDVVLDASDRSQLETALRHPNVRTDVDSAYGARGCPAGVEKLSVDPYGNVRPCPLLPGVWGSAREESLASLWSRMRGHAGLSERAVFCPAADLDFRERHPDLF